MSSICLKQSNSIINLYLSHFFNRMLYSIVVLWLQLKNVEKYTFCAPCFIRLAISLFFVFIHSSIHFHSELNGYVCNDFCCAAHVVFGFSKMLIKSGMVFFSFTRVVHFSFLRFFFAEKKLLT